MTMDPSSPSPVNADPAATGAEEEPPLLVLASRSPGRARILTDAGVGFEAIVSTVDEDAAVAGAVERLGAPLDAPSMALLLARTKAESVAGREAAAGAVVLGCDSIFELDGVC
ncbi:MAG: Maf family protein, partial [Micrococcaceae bacterium]|nr:Maf family protein [Micrococcaceae bacterium]